MAAITVVTEVSEPVVVLEEGENVLDDPIESTDLDELEADNLDLSEVNRQYEAEELATYLVEKYRESGILDSHSSYSDLVNLLVR